MKKFYLIIIILLIGGITITSYKLLSSSKSDTNFLNYNKIAFILPAKNKLDSKTDGDSFLAHDLKEGLEKLGYTIELKYRDDYHNLQLKDAGNVLYFKGYADLAPIIKTQNFNDNRKHIIYLYYLENLNFNDLKIFDMIVSASQKNSDYISTVGNLEVAYIPQFTNPKKFKNITPIKELHNKILFVGSQNSPAIRPSVKYAINANLKFSLYGNRWSKDYLKDNYKGNFIDNDILYKYYKSADIVLNDHRKDMLKDGFISNRIFDVTASGGFIFTDYMPEIEEIYGDSIATYKNYDEFKEKIEYYLAHPEIREEMAKKAQEITLNNFTNHIIARKFDKLFKSIKK